MNSLSLVILSVLALSFETLQAFPQRDVNLESGSFGGGAEAGAGVHDGITGARAGALGGASKASGAGLLRGAGGSFGVSSGALGGMSQSSAGTRGGISGASVQAQGGGARSGGEALGADGDATRAGSGASGGAAQAASGTEGHGGRAISGAVGGSAESGAEVLGEDGVSTNVDTGANGGLSNAGVAKVGQEANVHSGAIGGRAGSAAELGENPRAAQTAGADEPAGTPTPTEEEPIVGDSPTEVAGPAAEEEGFVFGEDPTVPEEPATGLTAEGDNPNETPIAKITEEIPADTLPIAIIGIPNGDESPIELIVPLPADNPNEEVKDAEDSETPPGERRFIGGDKPDLLGAAKKFVGGVIDTASPIISFVKDSFKNLEPTTKEQSEVAPEAAPVDGEANV